MNNVARAVMPCRDCRNIGSLGEFHPSIRRASDRGAVGVGRDGPRDLNWGVQMSLMIQAVLAMRKVDFVSTSRLNLRRLKLAPIAGLFLPVAIALFILLAPNIAHAQKIYTPEHPEVKAMCDKAMKVLTQKTLVGGTRRSGITALRGLAVLQYHKRYNQRVPKDDPFLKLAIDHITSQFTGDGGKGDILEESEMYYPCLAMILLAEYDAQKYKSEIKAILKMIKDRQLAFGAHTYKQEKDSGDTSQTQFVALAFAVAKAHRFEIDVDVAKRSLDWFVRSQKESGAWLYKPKFNANNPNGTGGGAPSLSMQAAGVGSVYLLADVLQLFRRSKAVTTGGPGSEGLPGTVRIYVKPVEGESGKAIQKQGPLVSFDRGRLTQSTKKGNELLIKMFSTESRQWQYYYLYALERYAFFREQADGNVAGLEDWYDQTIVFLKKNQSSGGGFSPRGNPAETEHIGTAFAVLFMVRSSEVINLPVAEAELNGDIGFQTGVVLRQDSSGKIRGSDAEQNLADTLQMMKEGATDEQLREVAQTLKKQITEFREKDDKSRGEIKAFLRSMIGANNYFRRLIAVRFLAGEQDMDNVPALIYGLGDPDFRIAIEAHNGLRLISRKIDSLSVSKKTQTNALRSPGVLSEDEKNLMQAEFGSVKKKWTNWFLKIRPGAELLD